MRKFLFVLAISALCLNACGKKEAPQPLGQEAVPTIVSMEHAVVGNTLKLEMQLTGGSHGLGYQIDRAEIDPYCNCPSFWRRFNELAPSPKNLEKGSFSKLVVLKDPNMEYAFRVRAIDSIGRFSEWSKTIRAQIDMDLFE